MRSFPAPFSNEDLQYRCCCNNCHVKKGASLIGSVEAVMVALVLLKGFLIGDVAPTIVPVVAWAVILTCLFYGLRREREGFLIPHLVLQAISMVALILLIVLLAIGLATKNDSLVEIILGHHAQGQLLIGAVIVTLLTFVVIIAIEIWFYMVILSCHSYLRDKREFNDAPTYLYAGNACQIQILKQ